jgi:Immunity protein Imm1
MVSGGIPVPNAAPPLFAASERRGLSEEYPSPSWDRVESLIRSLDGESRTDVTLDDGGIRCLLGVSGGNDGRYVVVVQEIDAYYHLVDASKDENELMVMIGGVPDYHPAAVITNLDTALAAAKFYLDSGERTPAFARRKGGKGKRETEGS